MTTRILMLLFAALLSGCAGMRIVDSDVRSFSDVDAWPSPVALSYRFERLPSQQAMPAQAQQLEALAESALLRVGLRRADPASHSVQLGLQMFRDPQAPWDDPRYPGGWVRPYGVNSQFGVLNRHASLRLEFEHPWYRRELTLVIRRLSDGRVVYETRARHDGRWSDDQAVLPAMFQAALDGFPVAGTRERRVLVEIPR